MITFLLQSHSQSCWQEKDLTDNEGIALGNENSALRKQEELSQEESNPRVPCQVSEDKLSIIPGSSNALGATPTCEKPPGHWIKVSEQTWPGKPLFLPIISSGALLMDFWNCEWRCLCCSLMDAFKPDFACLAFQECSGNEKGMVLDPVFVPVLRQDLGQLSHLQRPAHSFCLLLFISSWKEGCLSSYSLIKGA